MDVRYRVSAGLYNLPRRIRYSIRHHVRVSSVCKVLPLVDERPDGIGEWFRSTAFSQRRLIPIQMDQIPYPGPGVLFHVRMVVLSIILATVDVVALGVAMNTILTEGVGGTVLFANEVRPRRIQSFPVVDQPSVRNSVGQRLEFYLQVLHQHHRIPPRAGEWWGDRTSVGKQVDVSILYRTLHRCVGYVLSSVLGSHACAP